MDRRVVVSGYVFANIVHEASKYENDTEGLLCGNIIHTKGDQITDSNSNENREELEYALFDIIPYERVFSFYDHVGRIVLGIKEKSDSKLLLGWYKIRRNTSNQISMREKAVIKNFIDRFELTKGLVFILCLPQSHPNRSTIKFTYKCFFCSRDKKRSEGLNINIINLGQTGTHPEYRNRSCLIEPVTQSGMESVNTMTSATAIPLICDSFESTFLQGDGNVSEVNNIQKMYKETMTIMKQFQENLSEIEKDISRYEEEISQLRKVLSRKEDRKEETPDESKSKSNESEKKTDHDECEEMEESSTRMQISEMTLEEKNINDNTNEPKR